MLRYNETRCVREPVATISAAHAQPIRDALHTIYWEEVGNPHGAPVHFFLHGELGTGLSPQHRRFFYPQRYRVILFNQRGAGKSPPFHLSLSLVLM